MFRSQRALAMVALLAIVSPEGAEAPLPELLITFDPPSDNAAFGHSVSNAGDVNGDGYDDLIIGAPYYQGGKAYLFLGGPAADAHADLTLPTSADSSHNESGFLGFGLSVLGAGDLNGDGYADVVVGSPFSSSGVHLFAGSSLFYLGGPTLPSAADLVDCNVDIGTRP
jgi:hypothetical protein